MKGLHSPHDDYGITNPVLLYPAKIIVMEELVCSTHRVAGSFKLLFEVTMKNTDILNIKLVSLLLSLLLFKLGFVEYLKKKCIYIKTKERGSS